MDVAPHRLGQPVETANQRIGLILYQSGLSEQPVERGVEQCETFGIVGQDDAACKVDKGAMADVKTAIDDRQDAAKKYKSAPGFAPAGQSTQMIVGADAATDRDIVGRAATLYDRFRLRRVYYSAFSPIPDASAVLPLQRPPLMREHRLYQSDWLMRFYDYQPREVAAAADEATGMLPLDIDPKLAWALKFRQHFPVDVNRAPREMLLRVPGLGVKAVDRIIASRQWRRLRLEDVGRLTVSIAKLRPFLITEDWRPVALAERADLKPLVKPKREQLELFA